MGQEEDSCGDRLQEATCAPSWSRLLQSAGKKRSAIILDCVYVASALLGALLAAVSEREFFQDDDGDEDERFMM